MKDIRQWIDQISSDCEDDIDFQERLIEEVIKPLMSESFAAGAEISESGPFFKWNSFEDWFKSSGYVTSNKQ
jgi:hypothetical protein